MKHLAKEFKMNQQKEFRVSISKNCWTQSIVALQVSYDLRVILQIKNGIDQSEHKSFQKFDGSYFHVCEHRLLLVFKQEELLLIVECTQAKLLAPTIAQITSVTQLATTNVGNIVDWE